MQALVGEGREVAEMAEGVFAEHLADYPGLELTWLQGMFEQRAMPAQAAPLLPSSGAASQAAAGLVGLLPAAIQSRFAQARRQAVCTFNCNKQRCIAAYVMPLSNSHAKLSGLFAYSTCMVDPGYLCATRVPNIKGCVLGCMSYRQRQSTCCVPWE